MTTQTPASAANTDEAVAATPISASSGEAAKSVPDAKAEAKQQEEQWRTPQLLTALVTPILGLISVIFNLSGINTLRKHRRRPGHRHRGHGGAHRGRDVALG